MNNTQNDEVQGAASSKLNMNKGHWFLTLVILMGGLSVRVTYMVYGYKPGWVYNKQPNVVFHSWALMSRLPAVSHWEDQPFHDNEVFIEDGTPFVLTVSDICRMAGREFEGDSISLCLPEYNEVRLRSIRFDVSDKGTDIQVLHYNHPDVRAHEDLFDIGPVLEETVASLFEGRRQLGKPMEGNYLQKKRCQARRVYYHQLTDKLKEHVNASSEGCQ